MRKSDKQLRDGYALIRCNIAFLQEQHKTNTERCAIACGVSKVTFCRRLQNPEEFTVGELEGLARLWNVPARKIMYGRLAEEVGA